MQSLGILGHVEETQSRLRSKSVEWCKSHMYLGSEGHRSTIEAVVV